MRQVGTALRWTLATALCLGGAFTLARPADAQEGALREARGRLNALNAATGALTVDTTALTTGNATQVFLNSNPVSLGDLAVGETAVASYDGGTGVARSVAVERPRGWLWGRVTGLSEPTPSAPATVTVRRRTGDLEVLVIGATSLIPLEEGTDLWSLLNTNVAVSFDPVTKVIFQLEPSSADPPEPDSAPYPAPAAAPEPLPTPAPLPVPVRYRAEGLVTAVDPTAGTVTLLARCVRAPKAKTLGVVGGGRGTTLVLHVGATAELMLDGKTAGLADLQVGDRLRCLYDAVGDQNNALKVHAFQPPLRVAAGFVRSVEGNTVAIGAVARPRVLILTPETFVSVDGVPGATLLAGQRGCALYRERGGVATAFAVVTMSPPVRPVSARKAGGRR